VALLHGVGGRAEDLMPVARRWASSMQDAEFVLPDGCHPHDGGGPGARQWFSVRGVDATNRAGRVRHAAAEVSAWLDEELARRSLGRDRLIIAGFSQGAILAEWLAVRRTPSPQAIVAFSGRFADDEGAVPGMTDTPVFLVHGAADPVMPAALAREARQALEARGSRVELIIEPGVGHTISERGIVASVDFLGRTLPTR
jgi:phospholipase/carboxylesterase